MKYIYWGGPLLALFALSLGYAGWEISRQFGAEGGGIAADGVIDINRYFFFEGTPSVFDYASDGLVYDEVVDPSLDNVGDVAIPFQLDVGESRISDHLPPGAAGLTIRAELLDKNEGLSLFSVSEVSEAKLSASLYENIRQYSLSPSSSETDADGKYSRCDFKLDDSYLSEKKVYFWAKFTLRFKPNSSAEGSEFSFKGDVYDRLDNGSFRFSLRAGAVI